MTSPDPSRNHARRALADYATRSPAQQSDIDRVMRALVEHDGWYVPARYATQVWGRTTGGDRIVFADAEPTSMLTVFTDREAALEAEGYPLGPYTGGVTGTRLFGSLGGDFSALMVNPASPRDQQWYVAAGGFDIARTWAAAVDIERALARRDGPAPLLELRAFRGFQLLLIRRDNAPARIHIPQAQGALGLAFTAADRVEEFLDQLSAAQRAEAAIVPVDGEAIASLLRSGEVAAVVLNPGSDHQVPVSWDDFETAKTVSASAS